MGRRVIEAWLVIMYVLCTVEVYSQCNALRPQIDINFNTDQDCAPVQVTDFRVTYYFNAPQDPATIQILYEWNDPLNSTQVVSLINGLTPGAGNTSFTANATFTYFDNNGQCNIIPTTYIIINGVVCPTSRQQQTAFFWGRDNQANAQLRLAPQQWDVCFDNPVINAQFRDNSEFNCNINVEPDNPNRATRHVQFVYGTNHTPGTTIRNLSLTDGSVRPLTDASGNRVTTVTRGVGAGQVTAAYFGPIQAVPFPADGPNAVSFLMNAPANVANLVGHRFEVTLYNWNICNPWNNDPVNPNYEDAIVTRGYIVIVESPQPEFETRDAAGNPKTDFCIGENIHFRNVTPNINGYTYRWEFYDDAAGATLVGTSTQRHPVFAYARGGTKRIRLRATNPTAQSPCVAEFDAFVNITPALVAQIGITDWMDRPITNTFCQEPASPFTAFEVRFRDASVGTVTPSTQWRWEFYNANNVLIAEAPSGGGFSDAALGPFDREYITPGVYRVRLRVRDRITLCETHDEKQIIVYEKPAPDFTVNRVCENGATVFQDASTHTSIQDDQVINREWDLNYNGTFNSNSAYVNQAAFSHIYASSGTYTVALRLTTQQGCSSLHTQTAIVDPLPVAAFQPDQPSGCSTFQARFMNQSVASQPATVREYIWELDEGSGYQVQGVQRPADANFSPEYRRDFINTGTSDKLFYVRLKAVSTEGCERTSAPAAITVHPAPRSGFVSPGYTPFNANCSPVTVDFFADAQTQSLNPSEYIWTVADQERIIDQQSTGQLPSFRYRFDNATAAIQDFTVTLRTVLPSSCYGDSSRIIRVNPVPSSLFDVDTLTFTCEQMVMRFTARQKGLLQYQWTITVDGAPVVSSTTLGDSFDYTFQRVSRAGQRVVVTLRTKNFAGCESVPSSQSFTVLQYSGVSAEFDVSPATQRLPEATVSFTNVKEGPWQYQWNFGDGSISNDPAIRSHTYETYGTYVITLTVADRTCTTSHQQTIRILPIPPVVDFDYYPGAGCAPLTVNFVNKSRYADPSTYVWSFGTNQGTSRAMHPSYTYYEPGIYSVTLSATNASGDTVRVTKQMIIEVYNKPNAQFAVFPRQISIPGDIVYTKNQSTGATSYQWDFGDGTTSTQYEPRHEYKEEGVFDITLVAINGQGCADTARFASAVKTINDGKLLIPNAFKPNRSGPGSTNILGNEVFLPLMRNVVKFQMMIFNRWGELLFESANPQQGWDGYHQGRLCQQDVYIYKIIVEYESGKTLTRMGDINLIR